MNNRNLNSSSRSSNDVSVDPLMAMFNPSDLVAMVKRQWPFIIGVAAVVFLLSICYLLTVQPRYTATAAILIDTRKNQLFQNQMVVGDMQVDAGTVESQVEILKSESVALFVIRDLKLVNDAEFMNTNTGLLSLLLGTFAGSEPQSDFQKERKAMAIFDRSLTVKRIGLTYAIEVGFTSTNPSKASQIANSLADAYMVGELDSKYQATKRASKWLQDRISELREQASIADAASQKFKADNNIVDTGRGQLISDQQLSDVNTQLITAKAATAEAKARLERIQEVENSAVPDATVADALRSEVITRLRAQYLDIAAREADWSQRFGRNHTATTNLRNQMMEIRRSIADEVRRIAQSFQSDYEIARARETSLQNSLNSLVGQSAVTGQAQVKLRDLDSTSQSYRNLYDNFLQRFMEATQQQTFPVSEARVITAATDPLSPSAPKSRLILLAGGFLGLFLGVLAAFLRERMDNVFRSIDQAEEITGMEGLGILPMVPFAKPDFHCVPADHNNRILKADQGVYRHVSDAPFSRFTETLRSVKVAADIRALSTNKKVIGMVSALPQEGKTTISANFAHMLAQSGQRVILIDCDLRNPSLTRSIVPDATVGLVEVLSQTLNEVDLTWTDSQTGLHVIPAVINGRISHTAELISSDAMLQLLVRLKERYDYIVLDLPPILPVVDVKAAGHLIDGFVLVVEWGKTTKEAVSEAIQSVEMITSKGIGFILNKANPAMLKRLETYKGRYYNSYYLDYGQQANKK